MHVQPSFPSHKICLVNSIIIIIINGPGIFYYTIIFLAIITYSKYDVSIFLVLTHLQ